jgi:hypothetical protein
MGAWREGVAPAAVKPKRGGVLALLAVGDDLGRGANCCAMLWALGVGQSELFLASDVFPDRGVGLETMIESWLVIGKLGHSIDGAECPKCGMGKIQIHPGS